MGRVTKNVEKREIRVALAGNPNVGKSTLFNTLTGLSRHTGNWSGKTVDVASASVACGDKIFTFFDIPGTYSLLSHSKEEEIARDFICFGGSDICVYVCDGTALLRSLPLLLQIKEAIGELIVVLNLTDEGKRRGISVDRERLARLLGSPVLDINAKRKKSVRELLSFLSEYKKRENSFEITYDKSIEGAIKKIEAALSDGIPPTVSRKFLALRLLEGDGDLSLQILSKLSDKARERVDTAVADARRELFSFGIDGDKILDLIVAKISSESVKIAELSVKESAAGSRYGKGRLDKILCGKYTAYPIMALFISLCFFITLYIASFPSAFLERCFNAINFYIGKGLTLISCPEFLRALICEGVLGTLFTVVAVMLPPMAIFFPMFALLEEAGYLPRIAYNLDRPFARCGACGKQSLTMCMGIGCNAVGVSEARIIDSKRERMLAILTNSFMPCNGRFPILATLGSVVIFSLRGSDNPLSVSIFVTVFVLLGVLFTFPVTKLLTLTILKGEPSSFTIELPPYRKPEIIKVILHSLKTKVLSVLLRAVAVAAPMGLFIFLLSRIQISGAPLTVAVSDFLNSFASVFGLDGVILLSFILGLPASEIVIPIMLAIYGTGAPALSAGELLIFYGFTPVKAICTAIFTLFHFPCSTTLITVYKETKSVKYTLLSALIPTLLGFLLCFIVNMTAKLFF